MDIRKDFLSIEEELNALLEYSYAFRDFNCNNWPHLKNREDFDRRYSLPNSTKFLYERLYADGRDIAVYFTSKLQEFNYADTHINITSYISSFNNTWLDELPELNDFVKKVKLQISTEETPLWSVEQMIILFEKQIEIIQGITLILNKIKKSKLYKYENPLTVKGLPQYIKENKMKTFTIISGLSSIIGLVLYFIPANADTTNLTKGNQSPIINGDGNTVNFTNSERVFTLKTTKLFFEPDYMKPNFVCEVEEGSKVNVIDEINNKSQMSWIQVKVIDGTCKNKTGWTGKGRLRRESN